MTTSTDINVMTQDFIKSLPGLTAKGMEMGARMVWDGVFLPILKEHWLAIMLIVFCLFVIATFKAMMGKWGSLGSLLYNLFYVIVVIAICLIWGPEVLVGDAYHLSYIIIFYPVCFWLSGWVMDRMGVGPHHPRR